MRIKILDAPAYKKGSARARWFTAIKRFDGKDVARFGAALVSPGLLKDEQFETIYNWFGDDAGARFIYTSGANPGLQAGLAVYPEAQVSVSVLSNTWGIGSRSAEMTMLAQKLAEMCITRNPKS